MFSVQKISGTIGSSVKYAMAVSSEPWSHVERGLDRAPRQGHPMVSPFCLAQCMAQSPQAANIGFSTAHAPIPIDVRRVGRRNAGRTT